MYFSDEIRSPSKELPDLPEDVELGDREVSMARLLLESMESEWDPGRYHDTHREHVEELIEEKRQGHEIVANAPVPSATKVVDLMEVLSASVDAVKARRQPAGRPSQPKKKVAAKRPTPVKKPVSTTKVVGSKKDIPKAPARRKAS
jgi:DNA end-binding protein Ku